MIAKILELLTGKDDVERVAARSSLDQLSAYLHTRPLLIPRRPTRFLDAGSFTPEQLQDQIRQDAQDMAATTFHPWILETDGRRRLPAFSSQKALLAFSGRISKDLGKVFSLGYAEANLQDIMRNADVDVIDLNLFSKRSWEISVRK